MTHDEMNRLAATRVMGWSISVAECGPNSLCSYECECYYHQNKFIVDVKDFNPCTSIADAWILVEKMMKDGFEMMLCTSGEDKTKAQCNIFLNKVVKGDKKADTAPLVITMACLQAKGVK